MSLKEGLLKKKMSVLTGYKDFWFILTNKGVLQYYTEKPTSKDKPPKGQMTLLLSDVKLKDDGISFHVLSANSQKYFLRAASPDERVKWVQVLEHVRNDLYSRVFRNQVVPPPLPPKPRKPSEESDDKLAHIRDSDYVQLSIPDEIDDTNSIFQERTFTAVAAIDFGSTYSGCAFSTVNEFKRNPLELTTIKLDSGGTSSEKSPTVLLLKPDRTFHCFGTKAAKEYTKLAMDGEACDYYYFERFKMQLYNEKKLTKDMVIKDASGKPMKAVSVFAICIEYMKDRVMERLCRAIAGDVDDDDIHWVLTVPAIWNEQARQFMITSAETAGIQRQKLSLALEPEGAAMCCKYLELNKKRDSASLSAFSPEARFMVVDMGGGTIDITVSEVLSTGQLKEIHKATGGPWGGNYVNKEIVNTLSEAIGWEKIRKLRAEDLDEYLKLQETIEKEKRCHTHGNALELEVSKEFGNKLKINESYKKDVIAKPKRIILSEKIIQTIVSSSIEKIITHVKDLLQKPETRGVSTIFLVGGYAAAEAVQTMFRNSFRTLPKIVFPVNPDMIVLKGAVIIGHMKEAITGRVARCHYGVAVKSKEKSNEVSVTNESKMQFFTFIEKGKKINVGDMFTVPDILIEAQSNKVNMGVFTSEDDELRPVIDDEHFIKIGSINIIVPRFKDRTFLTLTISYDETEFKVVATEKITGRCFVGVFNFLEKN